MAETGSSSVCLAWIAARKRRHPTGRCRDAMTRKGHTSHSDDRVGDTDRARPRERQASSWLPQAKGQELQSRHTGEPGEPSI